MATKDLVQKENASGEIYYELKYDLIVYFGLTEIKAELGWRTKVCVKPHMSCTLLIRLSFQDGERR